MLYHMIKYLFIGIQTVAFETVNSISKNKHFVKNKMIRKRITWVVKLLTQNVIMTIRSSFWFDVNKHTICIEPKLLQKQY